jgi:hypothetical protein
MSKRNKAVILFKCYVCTAALLFSFLNSFSQNKSEFKDYIVVFFMSGFNGDSVHLILNKDTIMKVRLESKPVLDQCNTNLPVKLSDSIQTLTIFELEKKRSFKTLIKKGFQYLYIFRLSDKDLDFDYSNKLRLPE